MARPAAHNSANVGSNPTATTIYFKEGAYVYRTNL